MTAGEPADALRGKRIAHLIESDGPGGAERMVAQLASEFAARGSPGVVFLPERGEGWLERELLAAGVTIERFRLERPLSPLFARNLADAFLRHRISFVHSHEFTMAVYGAWAARKAGVPHAITMHGGRYYAGRLQRRVAMRLAVAISGSVVAVSAELAQSLSRDLLVARNRITVIPNGVPEPALPRETLRDELALPGSARLLLAVGNLYPVKGHRHLVAAVALLAERHPDLHVAIAGRGENETRLRAQALELGIADRVHLLGFRSDGPKLLAGADIFVMPSLAEGLPLALLEAMFAGRPIIASDVGEIATALGADGGILVPPANEAALATAIDRLLIDPQHGRALGMQAARRASLEYSLARSVDRYAAVYAGLLGSARSRP